MKGHNWVKGWLKVALLLPLLLAGSMSCNPFGGSKPEVSQQLVLVERGDLTVTVSGSGNIEVSKEARLAFGSGGKIDKIYVKEGDGVSKGEVLAKLDTSALLLALTQARAALVQAKATRDEAEYTLNELKEIRRASYDRIKVAEAQLEAAESRLKSAEQAVAEAQKQLDEATITAPFNGLVVAVEAKEGDIIPSPSMAPKTIIRLIDPNSLEMIAKVDEMDIPSVKSNQKAIIEVDALPAVRFEGRVISISPMPVVEAGVVSYKVKIALDVSLNSQLKVGMSATADIIINERHNVLLVPNRAIKQDGKGNPVVKVSINGQVKEKPVVIGISNGFHTEVLVGLAEGEKVVVETRAEGKPTQPGFLF